MNEIDIPLLSFDGIQFGDYCFCYTYSLQSSSIHSHLSSSFDANTLESFINDKRQYSIFDTSVALSSNSEEWIVDNGMYQGIQDTMVLLEGYHHCKRIVIGNSCFDSILFLTIDGLEELETIEIGEWSFTIAKSVDDITQVTNSGTQFVIANCPKLKSIRIGNYSFSDCSSFILKNLPSLQSIDVACDCFYWTSSFSLTGLIWESLCMCRSSRTENS